MGSFSIWHWLIVLLIVVLIFGTKRLKNVGKDLGDAVKGFKEGVRDDEQKPPAQLPDQQSTDSANRADAPVDPTTQRSDAAPDDDRSPR